MALDRFNGMESIAEKDCERDSLKDKGKGGLYKTNAVSFLEIFSGSIIVDGSKEDHRHPGIPLTVRAKSFGKKMEYPEQAMEQNNATWAINVADQNLEQEVYQDSELAYQENNPHTDPREDPTF